MYELIVILSLTGSTAGATVILRLFTPRFPRASVTMVSVYPAIDTPDIAAPFLATYLSYRQ